MRIKVMSCKKRGDWYELLIGKTFEVEPTLFDYKVSVGFYKDKIIQREDIQKLTPTHHQKRENGHVGDLQSKDELRVV